MNDWQSWVAGGIVALVFIAFAFQLFRPRRKSGSCGHSCGCGHSHSKPQDGSSQESKDSGSTHSH